MQIYENNFFLPRAGTAKGDLIKYLLHHSTEESEGEGRLF